MPKTGQISGFGGGVSFLLFLLVQNPISGSNPSPSILPSKYTATELHITQVLQHSFNLGRRRVLNN